jgi:eukaryotic-like serine/threonine-protein kinase
MPLARGDTFGRYVVEEVLGTGGGGQVYRARDTLLHRAVALKVLLESAVDTEQGAVRARILREARAAAQLNHPNVVSIFDVGEQDGVPYMAMELVSGRSLRSYVGAPDLSIQRRLRWLSDIALALAVAHENGLVHRDVKPENVIVRDDGFIKVVDFGIARRTVVDPRGPTGVQSTENASAGTPHYMAPEQIRNLPLDGRADQFGWGVTAYELLSGGALPWDSSGGALKYVAAVLDEDAAPLAERARALPAEVGIVIDRTVRRAREERFATMEEVVRALDPFQSSGSDVIRHVVSVLPPLPSQDLAHQLTTKAPVSGAREHRRSKSSLTRPRRTVAAIVFLAVIAGAGALVALRWHESHPSASVASPSSSAPLPAPAPTPITSLPPPSTTDRKALAAYIEGIQAIRDGSLFAALGKLEQAQKMDHMLAAADLRLALLYVDRNGKRAREAYMRAHELRSVLGARDQALLEALEPMSNPSGKGVAEAARRLAALAELYPGDAEVEFDLQVATGDDGDLSAARAAGLRALAIDPEFYAVLAALGENEAYAGDMDEALRSLDRCLEKSGEATVCAVMTGRILEQRGECDRLEHDARRALDSSSRVGAGPFYQDLAEGMMAKGVPVTAVWQVLEQWITGLPDDERETTRIAASLRFDVATGDFVGAEKEGRRYEQAIAKDPSGRVHGWAASKLADLYIETGRSKEAGAVARAMLDSHDGWTQEPRLEDEGISLERTPEMLSVERAAGLIDDGVLAARRAEWLRELEPKIPPFFRPFLWVQAYPSTVTTEAEARDALDVLERYGGVPPFRPFTAAPIGRVYLLAGRVDDAMPLLLESARRCNALRRPFEHVRARYWLGRGYEAKGDVSSACTEYEGVLDRWGDARPRSVTADDARKRAHALRCARGSGDR